MDQLLDDMRRDAIAKLKEAKDGQELLPEAIRVLEESIQKLPDQSVQRMVRDVDTDALAVCVYGFGENGRRKILDNLSLRYAGVIKEKVVSLPTVSEKEMSDRAQEVLQVIDMLRKRGKLKA